MKIFSSSKLIYFWCILLNSFLLLLPSLYNGFPLVFSDTGTYITSGVQVGVPVDRPVMYGLFISITSLRSFLWLTVCCQAFITSYIIIEVCKCFIQKYNANKLSLAIVGILSLCSSVGWYCGQLMPDVFTALMILVIILICCKDVPSKTDYFIAAFISILAIGTHHSNGPVYFCFIIILILISFMHKHLKRFIKWKPLLIMGSIAVCSLYITNFVFTGRLIYSRGGNVMFMAKLNDLGVLKDYLSETCKDSSIKLCKYKDQLPKSIPAYLFDNTSPVYKEGGWEKVSSEYNYITWSVIGTPKYLKKIIFSAIHSTGNMMLSKEVGWGLVSNWYRKDYSSPYKAIHAFYPEELNQYIHSKQNNEKNPLDLSIYNSLNAVLMFFSYLFFLITLFYKRAEKSKRYYLIVFLFLGMLTNDFVLSVLADSSAFRYHARVSWLLPFGILLFYAEDILNAVNEKRLLIKYFKR